MSIFVSPFRPHSLSEPRPPGIDSPFWAYAVSTVDLAELEAAAIAVGADPANIRTPELGSSVTYLGINDTQRTAAIANGALEAPTEGLTRRQAFDGPASTWEPPAAIGG